MEEGDVNDALDDERAMLVSPGQKVSIHVHSGTPIEVPLVYIYGVGKTVTVGKALVYPDGGFAGEILAKNEVETILRTRRLEFVSMVWDPPIIEGPERYDPGILQFEIEDPQ